MTQGRCVSAMAFLSIAVLVAAGPSQAAETEGESLFKAAGCPSCHGADGSHPVLEDYPVIAGQNARYLLRQMRDIRDGRRTNGFSENMRAVVAEVPDAQLAIIADWLSSRW